MINDNYKYSELTGRIMRSAMTVHSELGNGFQEVIYQRALEIEFQNIGISYVREFEMPVFFKGHQIGTRRVDFLVKDVISVEIKATTGLTNTNFAQAINYLETYNLEVGLLINFGENSLVFKRFANKKFKALIKR
ncbi:MAG: GxxExxY protein [Bacteroidetes bacterium]|nr:GxxExxY protein [Bacteroidota bacterium]